MNGAQPLTGGVQFVPSGGVLRDQPLSEYDNNQGFGRANLNKSVTLKNKNKISTLVINDKWLQNGRKDVYRVIIDKSDGCDEDLRATLAWNDPPGPVGCTKCLVNDLDLSIKDGLTVVHPNGRSSPDTTNNVERIRTLPEVNRNGQEMRIFVNAKNLAFHGQKYSLVVTGCFTREVSVMKPVNTDRAPAAEEKPAASTTRPPLLLEMIETKLGCPSERLFKLDLNTSTDGESLAWDLVMSTADNGIETVASGAGYNNFALFSEKMCLDAGRRYRFRIRNMSGGSIASTIGLDYGGEKLFDSSQRDQELGRVSSYRFRTSDSGALILTRGRNRAKTHAMDAIDVGSLGNVEPI